MITLAITSYNRDTLTLDSFRHVLQDERISEIVIVDDHSSEHYYNTLKILADGRDKVKLYRNENNLGCYHNKRRAVELASNEWVILFDSDNIIRPDYLDAIFKYESWHKDRIYAPSFAKPHFDYRHFDLIDRMNIRSEISRKNFEAVINTCNFFINRGQYLKVFDQEMSEPWTVDTMYFNYCWMKAGGDIQVVPGMHYDHLVHDGSHYKEHNRKTTMHNEIMNKLRNL